MSITEEYNKYMKRQEMLGVNTFKFRVGNKGIKLIKYIENKDTRFCNTYSKYCILICNSRLKMM